MSATPREIVYRTLAFDDPPRAPRDIWPLSTCADPYTVGDCVDEYTPPSRDTVKEIDAAGRWVHRLLWRPGGCFAQAEFGGAVKSRNVRQVLAAWDPLTNANTA